MASCIFIACCYPAADGRLCGTQDGGLNAGVAGSATEGSGVQLVWRINAISCSLLRALLPPCSVPCLRCSLFPRHRPVAVCEHGASMRLELHWRNVTLGCNAEKFGSSPRCTHCGYTIRTITTVGRKVRYVPPPAAVSSALQRLTSWRPPSLQGLHVLPSPQRQCFTQTDAPCIAGADEVAIAADATLGAVAGLKALKDAGRIQHISRTAQPPPR